MENVNYCESFNGFKFVEARFFDEYTGFYYLKDEILKKLESASENGCVKATLRLMEYYCEKKVYELFPEQVDETWKINDNNEYRKNEDPNLDCKYAMKVNKQDYKGLYAKLYLKVLSGNYIDGDLKKDEFLEVVSNKKHYEELDPILKIAVDFYNENNDLTKSLLQHPFGKDYEKKRDDFHERITEEQKKK